MKPVNIQRTLFVVLALGYGLIASQTTPAWAEPANAKINAKTSAQPPAAEPAAPLSERYAEEGVQEVPDFQRHVVP